MQFQFSFSFSPVKNEHFSGYLHTSEPANIHTPWEVNTIKEPGAKESTNILKERTLHN